MANVRGVSVAIAVVLAASAGTSPVFAKEATPSDFWSAAQDAATATVYVPSRKVLTRLGLYQDTPFGLTMFCAGEWNVDVNYTGDDVSQGRRLPSIELYQSTKDCSPDPGSGGAPPSPSSVKVAGAEIVIAYNDCVGTAEGQAVPAEDACPISDRIYIAGGTLPAVGAKEATFLEVTSRGLTRAQVTQVIRSLRPAG
jgi:hypothetical protein